jgi:hypothetical protein
MKLTSGGLWAAVLSVCGMVTSLQGAEVPIDQRLPEEVVVLLTCPSGAEFAERFQQTNFGQMIDDPALADFRKEIEAGLETAFEQAETETGLSWAELAALIEGEIAYAVVAPRGETMGMVLMLEYGADNEATMDEIVDHLQEGIKDSEQGAEMSVDTIEGVDVTVYEFESDGDTPFNSLCMFRNEGHLCLASSVEAVESILIRWDGSNSSTLAGSEVYSYVMEKCAADGRPGDFAYFVDPVGLMNAVFGLSPEFATAGFFMQQYIGPLGLDKLHGIGGTMHMATEEFDTEIHQFIYADQPATGLMQVFSCTTADATPPDWVSADVQQYQCINWDLQGAYSAIESMYDTFNSRPGAFAAQVDSMTLPGGLHIKDDVVDLFSGQIHLVLNFTDPADITSQEMMIALAVESEDDAHDLVDVLVEQADGNIEERDFQGTTIYESPDLGAAAAPFNQPAFAIHDGLLVFGSSGQLVEQVVRPSGSESPLSQSKGYLAIEGHLPDEVAYMAYTHGESQVAGFYELIRSGQLDAAFEGVVDFSLLPEFTELSKYFTPGAQYAVPDDNGALFVGFGLKAE